MVKGDFVPLVYLALSIQLCAVLLSDKATLIIAFVQLCSLTALVLGIVSSFLSRRQMGQLEKNENELHVRQDSVEYGR